jgi:catechol 2,3-dioxygenase-like lactoylglutathione lyase family enzyme
MKFNKLIPELSVSNFETSLKFYTGILGFKIEYKRVKSKFTMISFQGSQFMIEEVNNHWNTGKLKYPFGKGINFQITVAKIKPILDNLKKNNYPIFVEPKENWYRQDKQLLGNKEFLIQDPDGYLLRFAEDLGTKPYNFKLKNRDCIKFK